MRERAARGARAAETRGRLVPAGHSTFVRTPLHVVEERWVDGEAARALHKCQLALQQQREEIEKQRRAHAQPRGEEDSRGR